MECMAAGENAPRADRSVRGRRTQSPEMEYRYLRAILLADGLTAHNAFVDRGFVP